MVRKRGRFKVVGKGLGKRGKGEGWWEKEEGLSVEKGEG